MIVECKKCLRAYDDEFRWTICPHETFAANDGNNNFAHNPDAYLSPPRRKLTKEDWYDCGAPHLRMKMGCDSNEVYNPKNDSTALKAAQYALERDRTKVAECVTAIKKELKAYDWLIDSRGSYEWDDDRWHDEFKQASKAISDAIEPMICIAADWSNCPKTDAEVKEAREDSFGI